jgi:hypothetical protein
MSYGKEVCYKSLKQAASHYKGETNYCSVIAFAVATGCKFGKARSMMNKFAQRKNGAGTYQHLAHKAYVDVGYELRVLNMGRGFMIANSASRLPRQGTFLIYSSCHVTCLRDGVIHDWCVEPRAKGKRMKQVIQVLAA